MVDCMVKMITGVRLISMAVQERRMKETGKKIVMDPKAALRKGLNVIKDYRYVHDWFMYRCEHWCKL